MTSEPRKRPDHISFIIIGILLLAGSQFFEGTPWPIGYLLRAICLAVAVISSSVALYLYDQARKT